MQSQTADVDHGAAIRRTGRNIYMFILSCCRIVWKQRGPQNRKYITHRTTVREGPSHGIGNMCRKFGEIWTCGFWGTRPDKQTKKQTETHRHADHTTSHTYPGGGGRNYCSIDRYEWTERWRLNFRKGVRPFWCAKGRYALPVFTACVDGSSFWDPCRGPC